MTNVVGDILGAVVLDRLDGVRGAESDTQTSGPSDEPSSLAIVA